MNVVISQPMLFPWLGLFEQIAAADVFVYYDDVQYARGFINRVQYKTESGTPWLSIPMDRSQGSRPLISELVEDGGKNWRQSHLDMLSQAYRDAEYRDEMLQLVEGVYFAEHLSLCDLIIASTEAVRNYLGLQVQKTAKSSELNTPGKGSQRLFDIVSRLGGNQYITGHGASNYLDHDLFDDAGIEVHYMDYKKTPYQQLYPPFTPYVSSLDMIANLGPESKNMPDPRTVYWKEWISK